MPKRVWRAAIWESPERAAFTGKGASRRGLVQSEECFDKKHISYYKTDFLRRGAEAWGFHPFL